MWLQVGHSYADQQPVVIHAEINNEDLCGGGELCTTDNGPGPDCDGDYIVEEDSPGQYQQILVNIVPAAEVTTWTLGIKFQSPVVSVTSPLATVTGAGTSWTLTCKARDMKGFRFV